MAEEGAVEQIIESVTLYETEIDKVHFVSFISTVLQEGFVLKTTGDATSDGKQLAFPVCFNMARTIPLENVISFVLDMSGSMASCFKDYVTELKAFVLELDAQSKSGKDFRNTTIRIRPFSEKADIVKSFSLQTEVKAILEYLDTLDADGSTYLNGAVAEEFEALEADIENKNVTVVIFTDGADNVKTKKSLIRLCTVKAKLEKMGSPPKVYTFGLGDKYDEDSLRKLTAISGTAHQRLEIISAFKAGLSRDLEAYCQVYKVARFVQEQEKEQVEFSVRIQEGHVVQANRALEIPGSFSVNGEYYEVKEAPKPEEAPVQSLQQSLKDVQDLLAPAVAVATSDGIAQEEIVSRSSAPPAVLYGWQSQVSFGVAGQLMKNIFERTSHLSEAPVVSPENRHKGEEHRRSSELSATDLQSEFRTETGGLSTGSHPHSESSWDEGSSTDPLPPLEADEEPNKKPGKKEGMCAIL